MKGLTVAAREHIVGMNVHPTPSLKTSRGLVDGHGPSVPGLRNSVRVLLSCTLFFDTRLKLSLVLEVDALDMADQPTIVTLNNYMFLASEKLSIIAF